MKRFTGGRYRGPKREDKEMREKETSITGYLIVIHSIIDYDNGLFIEKFHLAFSALSRLLWMKIFLQQKQLTKYYLWVSFEDIWSMSKLSKLDIQMAISAIKIKFTKKIFCKNVYHDVVAHVPNFQLSARSSSLFSAFFLHFYS